MYNKSVGNTAQYAREAFSGTYQICRQALYFLVRKDYFLLHYFNLGDWKICFWILLILPNRNILWHLHFLLKITF